MTPVTILREAEAELTEAVKHYEEKRPGLGFDFAREVEVSVESVRHFPDRDHFEATAPAAIWYSTSPTLSSIVF